MTRYVREKFRFKGRYITIYKETVTGLVLLPDGTSLQKWIEDNPGGSPGPAGDSAYQVWLDAGNTGTVDDFLDSLKGKDGTSVTIKDSLNSTDDLPTSDQEIGDGYLIDGDLWIYADSTEEGSISGFINAGHIQGPAGKSAYDIWLDEGNTGTVEDFLDSLKGPDGKSAYEVWIQEGNTGSIDDFLDSLIGESGSEGISVTSASVNDLGNLIITLSNGQTLNAGYVKGADGTSINILGNLESPDDLPNSGQNLGDCYLISGDLWVYTDSTEEGSVNGFINAGTIQGPAGRGITTVTIASGQLVVTYSDAEEETVGRVVGDSAYEVAVSEGFSGTEAEWLTSLIGPEGLSAYQVAVTEGFIGTESEWLVSLKGDIGSSGISAYEVAIENGFAGTEEEWLDSLQGDSAYQVWVDEGNTGTPQNFLDSLNGKSAYEVAVSEGFIGTELEWLASLEGDSAYQVWISEGNTGTVEDYLDSLKGEIGPQGETGLQGEIGPQGKSAYQVWLDQGNTGTVSDFLASLVGSQGDSAYEVWLEQGNVGTEQDFLDSLIGANGLSAYGVWISEGNTGTVEDFLNSLIGDSAYKIWLDEGNTGTEIDFLNSLIGEDGLSAYQVWINAGNTGSETDFLNSLKGDIGDSAYQVWLDSGNVGTEEDFLNSLTGEDGKSAYQVWIDAGNVGTVSDYLNSLKGSTGDSAYEVWLSEGNTGTEQDFLTSLIGNSAYQVWLDAGNTGTVSDYLNSLKGDTGDSAYETWISEGNTGSEADFIASLKGESAYQIWLDEGNEGTEQDFLDSLIGEDGANGLSAYQVWLNAGNAGTVSDFLASLIGADGKSTYQIWLDEGNEGTVTEFLESLIGEQGDSAYDIWISEGNTGTEEDFLNSLKGLTTSVNNVEQVDGNIDLDAEDIPYDNTASGLVANNTQSATDELADNITELENDISTLTTAVSGNTTDISDLDTRMGNVESNISDLEDISHEQNTDNTLLSPDKTKTILYTDNGGAVHIDGDIIQNGSSYETHAEQIYTKKDYVILREGAVAGLSVGEYTGLEAYKYDGTNNGRLVFDGNGVARVGDIGDEQPLSTREETPLDGGVAVWDATTQRYEAEDGAPTAIKLKTPVNINNVSFDGTAPIEIPAANVPYDNTTSGLSATTVQAAIDELEQNMGAAPTITSRSPSAIAYADWYRMFSINILSASGSAELALGQAYNANSPEAFRIALAWMAMSNVTLDCKVLTSALVKPNPYINKIRLVKSDAEPYNNAAYLDVYYANPNTGQANRLAAQISDHMQMISSSSTVADNMFVAENFTRLDDELGGIPAGYSAVEYEIVVTPPTTSSSRGTKGTVLADADKIYVCVDNGTWKCANLSTF